MYLFAIAACIFLVVCGFWLLAYLGFCALKKFCPGLHKKVESRLEQGIEKALTQEEREVLNLYPPNQREKLLRRVFEEEFADSPLPSGQLAASEHWINLGLKFEQPALFIRWSTSRKQLITLLVIHGVRELQHGELSLTAVLSGGVKTTVLFQFDPGEQLASVNIQLPRNRASVADSFQVNEILLRKLFGEPQPVQDSSLSQWDFLRVEIRHELHYPPYGNEPEERNELMSIRRKSRSAILKSLVEAEASLKS